MTLSECRNFGLALALLAVPALGACALPERVRGTGMSELPHPHIASWQAQHEVTFAPGASEITAAERERLVKFLVDARLGPRDDVRVAVERSNDAALDARRHSSLSELLAEIGADARLRPPSSPPPRHLSRAHDHGAMAAADVAMVQVVRYRLDMPACPDWSRAKIGDFHNRKTSNLGCATAANLGVHVADPRDLALGRVAGPADGERAVRSIRNYRSAEEGIDTPPVVSTGVGTVARGSR